MRVHASVPLKWCVHLCLAIILCVLVPAGSRADSGLAGVPQLADPAGMDDDFSKAPAVTNRIRRAHSLVRLGFLHVKDDPTVAKLHLEEARRLAPADPHVLSLYGVAMFSAQEYDKAYDALLQSFALQPDISTRQLLDVLEKRLKEVKAEGEQPAPKVDRSVPSPVQSPLEEISAPPQLPYDAGEGHSYHTVIIGTWPTLENAAEAAWALGRKGYVSSVLLSAKGGGYQVSCGRFARLLRAQEYLAALQETDAAGENASVVRVSEPNIVWESAYSVVVATGPNLDPARKQAQRISEAGFPSVVYAEKRNNGWYRILSGRFDTMEAARQHLQALRKAGVARKDAIPMLVNWPDKPVAEFAGYGTGDQG